jgi:hypothetical protein
VNICYFSYLQLLPYIHCRQTAPVENVSSTSGMYIKRNVLKKTQTNFTDFDDYTVYNVLNYQAL